MKGSQGYTIELGGAIEIQNPNSTPAEVTLTNTNTCCGPVFYQYQTSLAIPAGSWGIADGRARTVFNVSSSVPVRTVAINFCQASPGQPPCIVTPAPSAQSNLPAPAMVPSTLAFAWQKGASTAPAARTVLITNEGYAPVTATPSASWLSATTQPGGTTATLTVSVDPSQLAAGSYQGSIQVRLGYGPPASLPVSLNVTTGAVPLISANPATLTFTAPAFNAAPYSQTVALASDSGPTPFSVTLQPGTWLKVSPTSGTTPATLTVTWDPAVTSQIYYQERSTTASILINSPGNAITIAAGFNVTGVQTFQTFLGESGMGPNGLVFSAQTGTAAQTQTINVDPAGAIWASVDQAWMTAAPGTGGQTVTVTINPAGLAPGVYKGTVTVSESGLAPKAVPVTLGVWSTAPPLTITTPAFTFVQTVGEAGPAYQTAEVDSGGIPVPITIGLGGKWLNVVDYYEAPTPAPILVGVVNPPQQPGQYNGSFTIQSPGGSVYVPVTLLVEPGPAAPPLISQVVNAASGIAGSLSPGEIISIRGYGTGASAVGGLKLDPSGKVAAELSGCQVTFDGKAAPLLYTSANQTNLVVPYELDGQQSTVIRVSCAVASGALQTAEWAVPVSASAPGIFTIDATGTGQGAIVNQDGSINSAANPAARGSVISIWATGEGQTSPPGVTGSVTGSNTNAPLADVKVTIGGIDAVVQYAGSAPDEVAGVLQVNAVVPQGVALGAAPIVVSVGGKLSQPGVTVAVK